MAAVLDAAGAHPKRLSLALGDPRSTSPFPSPSSSFLPPPMPGPHEFAPQSVISDPSSSTHAPRSPSTPTMPTTPRPQSESMLSLSPKSQVFFSPGRNSACASSSMAMGVPSTPTTPTIASSRPAPASPALSRRSSSKRRSKRLSTASTRSAKSQQQHLSRLSLTPLMASDMTIPEATIPAPEPTLVIKVRDFAYELDDDRHRGIGMEIFFSEPEVEATDTDDADVGDDDWRGLNLGRFSTQFLKSITVSDVDEDDNDNEASVGRPTRRDFERNFGNGNGVDEEPDEEELYYGDDDGDADGEDGELLPGLYRAAYAFEPMGPTEMELQLGQLVRVIGRGGGGNGWAIVINDGRVVFEPDDVGSADVDDGESVQHALVPESYLELVSVDEY
ncbi:hypothetical protein FISHEDRAFT_73105 [Fistulina hepatica ATCC 64428]|uniref:SH3 domain-containing protein n=1 Tax=Fistulina hepatica ATCC 64428 TaxID=1128425 RepID=A0A0D7AD78_9AGAR|nr:hypothetical protein FISHEDRAFT_73105 [Fistulina hepatica ATCC 64428]